jgi:hypothetical protein
MVAATIALATAIGAAIGGKKGATFGAVSGSATRCMKTAFSQECVAGRFRFIQPQE